MLIHEVKQRLEEGLATTACFVNEFSGGSDHYSVVVVSSAFAEIGLLKRHRMVMDLFQKELASGEVHALTIKAFTPEQWAAEKK